MVLRKDIGNVDSALEELGSLGKYTLIQFSMQILAQVSVGHHMLSIVFTGQKNPFRCLAPGNQNSSAFDQTGSLISTNLTANNFSEISYGYVCQSASEIHSLNNISTSCNAYSVQYQLPKDRYFVSEFDLICEREYLAGLTQTLLTLGHAIGSLAVPYFADNYGRKPVLLVCSHLWLASALAQAFSVNYTMFAIFKTLGGIFLQSVAQTSITVMVEILTGRQRGYMFGCLAYIFWTVGIILMVPVAYALQEHSWRMLELAYCSYFIFILLYIFFMDESLRWLAANGLKERVVWVLKKASRWNGSNFDQVISAFYKVNCISPPCVTELCRVRTAVNLPSSIPGEGDCVIWDNDHFQLLSRFFNSLTYYGLFLMSSSLSGSVYLNYFLNSAVEFPSAIFIYFYIDRNPSSATTMNCFLRICNILFVKGPQNMVITVLAIIGKFGISGSFATIYTMTPELLPTTIRNTGLGLANMSACVGGMLAPFAELLMSKVVYGPGLIFGSGSLVLGIWAFFLPETANRQLPQSLRDIRNWSREPKTTNDMCTCCSTYRKKETPVATLTERKKHSP
ncbi:unnamed protein product [Candidula unifasciata]|uniref:Major facilitator superfamily (MFS) profile domain-containing protein n=1 Tax=Candidula unifasciata TaxID=100452 RepID=A0A8S4A2Y1_9EUPU|nr:unnamed protein product [Candidula unifasciata]